MEALAQDLRYALRNLAKNPGFATAAIVVLALGIGATSALSSVISAVLLQPLPFRAPERLVMIWENDTREGNARNPLAPANLVDFQSQNRVFESLVFFDQPSGANLTGAGEPERVDTAGASWNLLATLGVAPELGRDFVAGDARPGAPPVAAIISHGLWRRRFASDPSAVGRTLTLDGFSLTIVGVTPERFELPERVEVLCARALAGAEALRRGQHYLRALARLRPRITLGQARAEMDGIARSLERAYPDSNAGRGVTVLPVKEQLVAEVRPALAVLFAAVGLVLGIACANVGFMVAARAARRPRELAVRIALGAGRARLLRQLVTESLVLAFIGGGAGLLVAAWGLDLLLAAGLARIPRAEAIGIDRRVLGFTLGVSVLTGLLFSLAPALGAARLDPGAWLRAGRAPLPASRRNRTRGFLVASEIALALGGPDAQEPRSSPQDRARFRGTQRADGAARAAVQPVLHGVADERLLRRAGRSDGGGPGSAARRRGLAPSPRRRPLDRRPGHRRAPGGARKRE
ncbi:MAG: hypothetical protein DMG07_25515 [Acidobacteria bacterium]|nr:MAG: hypothetical protein DMG07_25515 [Acidobacteriota bacterium]